MYIPVHLKILNSLSTEEAVADILPVVGRLVDQVSGSPGDDCLLPLGSSAVAGELLGRPGVGQPGVLILTVPQHSQTAAAP